MLASYKRYWEPSLPEVVGVSLPVGAITLFVTQPIEFVKTRIQVRTEGIGLRNKHIEIGVNPWKVFRKIHETGGGMRQFYYGFDAALMSRLGYLFVRNILYKVVYDRVKPVKPINDLSNREKAVLSGAVGGLAALVTSPFELIQTRMIADGGLPSEYRRNYSSAFEALSRIQYEEGGSRGLFKGSFAHVVRMVVMNASITGPYDYMKEKINITFGDFGFNHHLAVVWAAGWATVFTLPFDNIRTRIMKQFPDPSKNRLNYLNYREAWQQALYYEGSKGLWAGGYAFYGKMLIMTWLTTALTELYTSNQKRKAGLKEWQI